MDGQDELEVLNDTLSAAMMLLSTMFFVCFLIASVFLYQDYSKLIVKWNFYQLIGWNLVNFIRLFVFGMEFFKSVGFWHLLLLNQSKVVMLTWLEINLFGLNKIIIYEDPENDTEGKIKRQLSLLRSMMISYGVLAAVFNIWNMLTSSREFKA